jgi:predicted acetyltransferase
VPAVQHIDVSLARASKSDEDKLRNLLHLYVHDFSEFIGMKPSEEGRFSYPTLPLFLSEANRAAFVVRFEGDLVGFALVSQGSVVSGDHAVFDLAEFFVVRGVRRRGVGQAAARDLFRSMPGEWEIRVADYNVPAQEFWRSVMEQYFVGYKIEAWTRDDGSRWNVMRFTSFEEKPQIAAADA